MTRVDPQTIVSDWIDATGGDLAEPGYVERARIEAEQQRQIDSSHFFEWKVDELERAIEASRQLELSLPKRDARMHARLEVADYLERIVFPSAVQPAIFKLPARLRECRQEFRIGVRPSDGKLFIHWDSKAGLPLLCPDDAREEAMRVSRRVVPKLLELRGQGMRTYSCVFTQPNCAPGDLQTTIRRLFGRFRGLLKMRKDGRKAFPQIKGALVVLEAPLGRRRDWHPHLNVILVTDGSYLSFGELQEAWHWMVHIREVKGTRENFAAAMRELIKYGVRTVAEKSKAKQTEEGAPPLVEWSAGEFLEWFNAHRGLRRTRGYGALYGLEDAPKEDTSTVRYTGSGKWCGGGFVVHSPLLKSIPWDKSHMRSAQEIAIEAFRRVYGSSDDRIRMQRAVASIAEHYGPVSLAV